MAVSVFQVLTIVAGFIFLKVLLKEKIPEKENKDCRAGSVWTVEWTNCDLRCETIPKQRYKKKRKEKIILMPGEYTIGTSTIGNDIYLSSYGGKQKVKLLFNVRDDRVYIAILRGSICIDGNVLNKDNARHVVVTKPTIIYISNLRLEIAKSWEEEIS